MFHQKLFVRRMWAVAWKNRTAGADSKVVCHGAFIARMKSVGEPLSRFAVRHTGPDPGPGLLEQIR